MKISVAISGVSGSVGMALAAALVNSNEFTLCAGVSRRAAGRSVHNLLNIPEANIPIIISPTIEQALAHKPNVLIDYTHASVAFENCAITIKSKTNLVIGTSGLTSEQLEELNQLAQLNGVGVFASGNFSITASILQHIAQIAAQHLPHWEIIDYGKPKYTHAPSSTGRELADKLSQIHKPEKIVAPEDTLGLKEARGATISGAQLHSIRSPGFGFSVEAIFGLPSERLVLRHDASESAVPYVHGTLLAAKAVTQYVGLKRGLDKLLFS